MDKLGTILSLLLLELSLSADNAIALATVVVHLPTGAQGGRNMRTLALKMGIAFAFVIRVTFLTVLFSTLRLWPIKVIGGVYLVYLAFKNLPGSEDTKIKTSEKSFWRTVSRVGFIDLMFSIDNIAAAAAYSRNLLVIIVAVSAGMFLLAFAARFLIASVERFPVLEKVAYVLILWVGIQLLTGLFGIDFSQLIKLVVSTVIAALGVLYERSRFLNLTSPYLAEIGRYMSYATGLLEYLPKKLLLAAKRVRAFYKKELK